jgi:sigma-B regulation protein RsbU (phosphoserine phosphatase)
MSNLHHRIRCAEIWGGIAAVDQDVSTSSLSISIYSEPCNGEAGGDIYYVSVCGGDQLTRIAIADLQGHGEEVSAMSRRIYESLVDHLGDLDNGLVLSEMNRFAIAQGYDAMTTAVVVSFVLADGVLSYTYAGHPPVLLKQRKGGDWSRVELPGSARTNPSLGIFDDARFEQGTLPLQPGDRFCVYTDGVTDCPSPDDQPFGEFRLKDALARRDGQPVATAKAGILEDLRSYAGGALTADDTTLVVA